MKHDNGGLIEGKQSRFNHTCTISWTAGSRIWLKLNRKARNLGLFVHMPNCFAAKDGGIPESAQTSTTPTWKSVVRGITEGRRLRRQFGEAKSQQCRSGTKRSSEASSVAMNIYGRPFAMYNPRQQ
ncbi:hypothetical protein LOK49_LG02G02402 [Camellia lanceoleosa]|uniref:Uncharacterized protein n=1 Tax=Camellia lanceoleosa TaxID=1840588 RepID=A0ACC0INL1_9ERIC|nr:hypothetical protein LOK49_LG02G02402 [Camellia lanceoleosa]